MASTNKRFEDILMLKMQLYNA